MNSSHKPGPGWRHLGCSVHERADGLRVNGSGAFCRLPDGELISGHRWPERKNLDRCVAIAGSMKRGAMVWAKRFCIVSE